MKRHQIVTTLLLTIFVFSCKDNQSGETPLVDEVEIIEPKINLAELELNFMNWWTYHSNNITLSSNFISLNENSATIDKKEFLEKLITSKYIPVKLKSNKEFDTYKLFKLHSNANKSIGSTLKSQSLTNLKHYNMEGMHFPDFDFTDLNGNVYTNENTKGKILILKTWFINCIACVAEFPELNAFVEKYKQRKDIIFLSLALDSKAELEVFLQKKVFKYQVVSNQNEFIGKKMNLQIFPTHILVDSNGTILKVVNKASEMIAFFENENILTEKTAPPPPPM
ncbi:hypothetical protein GCM10011416_14350 [Polaribacter pacificus]|uniref:Thioredoxin domain-containing protein n=1 Tax=Polaribacter pacificus TaxID=1775173 RepID=A0A917HZB2_9FLAO|nr:TlpA disulfide reductase family protein [Polaribacter pacificus]GGG97468.1 hypothetical protein GCM10011416_14350 [Polaribacter pacificus]